MDLLFLGTGASEALPCPFCRCETCAKARVSSGRDVRARSAFRIDGRHQIDFSPDTFAQTVKNGLDLFDLEHLLITHTHEDHFYPAELISRECAVPAPDRPMYIYLNEHGIDWSLRLLRAYLPGLDDREMSSLMDRYRFVGTSYFKTFRAGDLEVTPVKANHRAFGPGEYGQNYVIRLKDGRLLLWALDTGWWEEETWEFMGERRVDLLAMDCTFGGAQDRDDHPGGHLDVRSFLLMLEKMAAIGVVDKDTRLFATHINHKHSLMHGDMQRVFDQSGFRVTVAWDGLRMDEKTGEKS